MEYYPFNLPFIIITLLFLAAFILVTRAVRDLSDEKKRKILARTMIFTIALFVVYKFILFTDKDYSRINYEAGIGGFSWWKELPLHLCNINMILIPISMKTHNRRLELFSFYVGPLGAFMALLMPATGFVGYSVFLPRMICFIVTHWLIFYACMAIGVWRIAVPEWKDYFPTILTILIVNIFIFGFNMLLRGLRLEPHANYFYNVETEGNFVLDLFFKIIPLKFFYSLLASVILMPYMCIVTLISRFFEKKRNGMLLKNN